jgi:hypothetical protein
MRRAANHVLLPRIRSLSDSRVSTFGKVGSVATSHKTGDQRPSSSRGIADAVTVFFRLHKDRYLLRISCAAIRGSAARQQHRQSMNDFHDYTTCLVNRIQESNAGESSVEMKWFLKFFIFNTLRIILRWGCVDR